MKNGPLAGVRVVDLTTMIMGPYATQIMADMGADVIKIEPPAGDPVRNISEGPTPGMSAVFVNVNRGKRSLVLDLKTKEGMDVLRELIKTADIFIHSQRSKAIARLNLDYAAVSAINPEIVYTNCYGYRRGGPNHDLTAYDDTIQAECGLASVQEMLTGEMSYIGSIVADKIAGLTAFYSTLLALFHRQRTGEGQEVEVGMFETMAAFTLVEHANGSMFTPATGPGYYPRAVSRNRRPYRTLDGHVAVLIYNDKQWNAFVGDVKPAWNVGDRFSTLAKRARLIDEMYAHIGDTLATRTTKDWMDLFRLLDIPASAINSPAELFSDPHLAATGFFETLDTEVGPVKFPGMPASYSRTPGRVAGYAPQLGADTAELIAGLFDRTEVCAQA